MNHTMSEPAGLSVDHLSNGAAWFAGGVDRGEALPTQDLDPAAAVPHIWAVSH